MDDVLVTEDAATVAEKLSPNLILMLQNMFWILRNFILRARKLRSQFNWICKESQRNWFNMIY